jgi:hypothetical protein
MRITMRRESLAEDPTLNKTIPQAQAALEQAIAQGNTHLADRFQALLNPGETPDAEVEPLPDLDQF